MSAQTIRFPKAKKRGAKVKHGPMATMLRFPALLRGAELEGLWAWLEHNHKFWRNEETSGQFEDPREVETAVRFGPMFARLVDRTFDEAYMREEVAKWQRHIEKRTAVKDWLETLGVDWHEVKCEESALFFVFDKMQGQPPAPPAA